MPRKPGQHVRASTCKEEFVSQLVLILLPFPILRGVVRAISFGFPFWPRKLQ